MQRPSIGGYQLPSLSVAVFSIVAGLFSIFNAAYLWSRFRDPAGSDFSRFYVAAKVGLTYGWGRIYDLSLPELPKPRSLGGTSSPYLGPPSLAWFVSPLTALTYDWAFAVWTVMLVGLSIAACLLLSQGRSTSWRILAFLSAIGFTPFALALGLQQVTVLVLTLTVLGWWLLTNDRPLWAGAILAVALSLKPQLLSLAPVALLLSGQKRAIIAGATVTCAVTLVSLVGLGWSGINQYRAAVLVTYADHGSYLALDTLIGTFGTVAGVALTAAVVGLVGWAGRLTRNRPELSLAAGLAGSLLITTYVILYDFTSLLVAAGLIMRTRPPSIIKGILGGAITLCVLHNLLLPLPAGLIADALVLLAVTLWAKRTPSPAPSYNRPL